MTLREAGVDTSIGKALIRRKDTPINAFFDNNWTPEIGRSPTKIAKILQVEKSKVISTLRHRRDSLATKVEHLDLSEYDHVIYTVDPYTMTVKLIGHKKGEDYTKTLTEKDLIKLLRKAQIK